MAKKDRQCDNKVRHKTKEGACIAADKAVDVGTNVYQCPKCKFWHIGRTRTPTRSADRIGALLRRHAMQLEKRMKGPSNV